MISKNKWFLVVNLLVITILALSACQPAEPETITETIVETVEVEVPEYIEVPFDPYAGLTPKEPGVVGGYLDAISMSVVTSDTAVTQIAAGAIDIYASNLSTVQDFEAIEAAGLERSTQFGLYYELTFNPVGPVFTGTGGFNPFSNAKIREAMNWLVDRDLLSQEIYGGTAIPKFFSLISGFPDYARYVDLIRPYEAKYAYDFEKAESVIAAEMEAMGAAKVGGQWTYEGEVIELIFLIRNDSDGTRIPIGDYVSNQLEAIGFTVDRQYKTSSEASPLWVLGNPDDGLWHLYTGAWGAGAVARDDGGDFQFMYSPNSGYGFTALWQSYATDMTDEFMECSEALANNTFTTLEERREMFDACLAGTFELSYRVWLEDGVGASTWQPNVSVAYDLAAGVDINALAPFTLKFDDRNGGLMKWADPDLFVDPANPVAGSNWTYDAQWQNATSDWDVIMHPHTGLSVPQRLEKAEVTIQEGLPVGKTLDWVDLQFAAQIDVPADAWIDWDPASETFITVGEAHPDGLTAKRKVVHYYPAGMLDKIYWHDGSQMTTADFIMGMIMTFATGTEGSPIYDESQAGTLESFKATFKGFKLVSEDPLVFEYYSDTFYLDAELNAVPYRAVFWPEYGYGQAPWHMMAVANLAEADQVLAYSGDKADALEVEWMNFIGGPSLEILSGYVDQALEGSLIPFEATMGDFVTAEEAANRYANLEEWYRLRGHFWVGTGPYFLDDVFLVEKTCTLKHNPYYIDPSDKWAGFAEPKLAAVDIDGPGIVAIGEEAVFDVFVTFAGAAYPQNEISEVKYLLFNAAGEIAEVGTALAVAEGQYSVTLSADTTGMLEAGANKLEVAVLAIPVSVPSFSTLEFVTE